MQCLDWLRSGSCAPPQIAEMLSHTNHKDEERGRGRPPIKICYAVEKKWERKLGRKYKWSKMTKMYGGLTSTRYHSKHLTSINANPVTILWLAGALSPHFTDEEA